MSESISLNVTGMKCGGCEINAKTKLEAVDGVISVVALHKEKKIDIEFEAEKTNSDALEQVISDAGYKVI